LDTSAVPPPSSIELFGSDAGCDLDSFAN
jgi:hypothetical protein